MNVFFHQPTCHLWGPLCARPWRKSPVPWGGAPKGSDDLWTTVVAKSAVDGEHPSIYRVSTIRLVVQDCADFNLIALGMELGSRMVPWSINRNWGDFSAKKGFNIRWINIHSHVGRAPKFAVLLWQPVYQRVLVNSHFWASKYSWTDLNWETVCLILN